MFLIDNYKKYNDGTLMHKEIINKLINSSNIKNKYYTDIAKIKSIKSTTSKYSHTGYLFPIFN